MKPQDLVQDYLDQAKLMQIATVDDGRPWICTVYYVHDEDLNLYWLSLPMRRHSRDIANNENAAIAIAIKPDQPVVGVQAEGVVEAVNDSDVIKNIMHSYVDKYATGEDFYDKFVAGDSQHQMYKFTPASMMLFDEVRFKGSPTVAQKVL